MALPFSLLLINCYFFRNFLRPNPASPIRPIPIKIIVVGSGTRKTDVKLSCVSRYLTADKYHSDILTSISANKGNAF